METRRTDVIPPGNNQDPRRQNFMENGSYVHNWVKSWENIFSTWPVGHGMGAIKDTLYSCSQTNPKKIHRTDNVDRLGKRCVCSRICVQNHILPHTCSGKQEPSAVVV